MNIIERYKIKYQKDGIARVIYILLKKIGISLSFSSFIEKKYHLIQELLKKTKNTVHYGLYKSLKLENKINWNKNASDLGPKLVGCYEKQVQYQIIQLIKKYNLKYLIQFGASEGYHALGLIKNNFFKKLSYLKKMKKLSNF